ncbi:MAG TPA: ABC transporter ATP-binding protein [bacterium]|nr:ABC transporter ATP-binding protein [bacterium]
MENKKGVLSEVKIKIENLNFSYQGSASDNEVLDDFNLEIHNKEFVTIIGPSGCGKTTLLNIVAGLFSPTRGRILLDNKTITDPGSDRTMVFQDDAVFPWYTVRQNVEYGLKIMKIQADQRNEIVRKNLEMVGLLECENMFPRQLSGGMRKRVDVARALSTEPEVLLMDEPFAALDVMTKEKLQEEFLNIWGKVHMTVLFVTHDLEEAIYLSDRVVVMSRAPGRIIRDVKLPFGRPRNLDIKTINEFQNLRRELAHVIEK